MTYFIDLNDKRNLFVKQFLQKNGEKVKGIDYINEAISNDSIIFAPNKKLEKDDMQNYPSGVSLFCGNITEEVKELIMKKNIIHKNLLKDEKFAIKNAGLTAEGILALILQNTEKSIDDINALILGAGRVGKATARLFEKLNINFSFAVFSQKSFNETHYFKGKQYFGNKYNEDLSKFDVIINTIPAKIIEEKYYSKIQNNCLFLEIASIQSLNAELIKHFTYLLCPALPMRFSAESAGKIMFESIKK